MFVNSEVLIVHITIMEICDKKNQSEINAPLSRLLLLSAIARIVLILPSNYEGLNIVNK